jgi:hypothetical protein
MRKINPSKRIPKVVPAAESEAAYKQAQQSLKDLEEGYVQYCSLYTTTEQIETTFPRIISGEILNFQGHRFYWKRPAGEPLVLYGKNEEKKEFKPRGLIELCRLNVPDVWVGVGRFKIDWPEGKRSDDVQQLLITLYLHSTKVNDLAFLVSGKPATAAFMASLLLRGENASLFYFLAEQRFQSLE